MEQDESVDEAGALLGMEGVPPELLVIYDGTCPFCTRHADAVRLRARGIVIQLADVRDPQTVRDFPDVGSRRIWRLTGRRWASGLHSIGRRT